MGDGTAKMPGLPSANGSVASMAGVIVAPQQAGQAGGIALTTAPDGHPGIIAKSPNSQIPPFTGTPHVSATESMPPPGTPSNNTTAAVHAMAARVAVGLSSASHGGDATHVAADPHTAASAPETADALDLLSGLGALAAQAEQQQQQALSAMAPATHVPGNSSVVASSAKASCHLSGGSLSSLAVGDNAPLAAMPEAGVVFIKTLPLHHAATSANLPGVEAPSSSVAVPMAVGADSLKARAAVRVEVNSEEEAHQQQQEEKEKEEEEEAGWVG